MNTFKRTAARKDIPDHPGVYYWSEYKQNVKVVLRRGGLYVTPPINGAIEIKTTPNIAGHFEERQ